MAQAQSDSDPVQQTRRLLDAYPDFLTRIEGNDLVWRDGRRTRIDDEITGKDLEMRLARPDLKDMFVDAYLPGSRGIPPGFGADPGRVRHFELFDRMYGDCRKGEVERNLVQIVWLPKKWGKRLRITKINGVAAKLEAVGRELDDLPARFDTYLFPHDGTYNCRPIAGTDRISAHGHGIAIDLAAKHSDYWRWSAKKQSDAGAPIPYRNNFPIEIVQIFERHGFIWGGKWYHYDTMHFEYRPELLVR
jgi:hypothetical protein